MSAPTASTRSRPRAAVGGDTSSDDGRGRVPAMLAILVVVASVVAAPFQSDLVRAPALELLEGTAEVESGGEWAALEAGRRVAVGTRVRTTSSTARFGLADGTARTRSGTILALAGRDEIAHERGSLLLEVDGRWSVAAGLVAVAGAGAIRVDLGEIRRVAVYRGGASVREGDRATAVSAYDQVDLADLDELDPQPLRYSSADPWDLRLLADAIDVDEDVAAIQRGLTAQYGLALQDPGFYGDFLAIDDVLAPVLADLAPRQVGERFGPAADVLAAVVITRALVDGARLSTGEAVAEVRRERAAGATWGLILAARDLGPRTLGGVTEDALRRRALAVEQGRAVPVQRTDPQAAPVGGADASERQTTTPRAPADDEPDPSREPEPAPTPDPTPVPTPVPTPPQPPVPDPAPGPVGEVVEDVVDTVDELLGVLPVPPGDGSGDERGGGLLP